VGIPPPPSAPPGNELDWLRSEVARFFPVYETRVTPNSLVLLVHVDAASLEQRFDELRRDLWPKFYIPQVRYHMGEYAIEIVRRPRRTPWGFWVNVGLLIATVVTTVFAGSFFWVSYTGGRVLDASDFLYGGLYFAAPLMAILGLHELAHFLMARHHHVEASLPYFLPVPPPYLLFGTFGAFISVREPFPNRKVLFDIGAAGPLAGFAISLPVTVAGMFLSIHAPVISPADCGATILGVSYNNLLIGLPLVFQFLELFVPNFAAAVSLHPLALAGWVGILVTAINLLPAGQLDGGHVFRGLFGDRSRYVSWGAVVFLSIIGLFFYIGWFVYAILILFLGMRHPPPLNDVTPLDSKRYLVGAFVAVVLVTGFVLVPISQPGNSFALESPSWTPVPGAPQPVAANVTVALVNHDPVDHAYIVSGGITAIYVLSSQGNVSLIPGSAAWNASVANSTWRVVLPSGATLSFPGVSQWSLSASEFVVAGANALAALHVTFTNTAPGTFTLQFAASQLCNTTHASPPSPVSVMVR
jgi:membrane-associated protease RseP (regulator of RpoE activity)